MYMPSSGKTSKRCLLNSNSKDFDNEIMCNQVVLVLLCKEHHSSNVDFPLEVQPLLIEYTDFSPFELPNALYPMRDL